MKPMSAAGTLAANSTNAASVMAGAVKAALLARSHVRVSATDGIVAESVDASIRNLGRLSREGMLETDRQIVRIMLEK